ncbi:hypothetical protein AWC15_15465 [Mycobacterium lacus]|nr:hypothetical protein AWC15_15465 [Mycobacterium lacus]
MWVVSNPTADHLSTLRSVFRWQPNARIMLEKPAFSSQEIDEIRGLLAEHPQARLMVNQLYRHSRVVSLLRAAMPHAGGRCPDSIEIAFTRDHRLDNPTGRFSDVSDTDYHVLGYEWIHMLSVLEGLLPRAAWQQYLTGPMEYSRFTATRDSGGSVTGLREHSWIGPTRVSMYSTITKDLSGQGAPPGLPSHWQRITHSPARHRYAKVQFGDTVLTTEFDPVTTVDGYGLPQDRHRLTIESKGRVLDERIIVDSPPATSLLSGLDQLTRCGSDLTWLPPVRRLVSISRHLAEQRAA